MTAPTQHPDGPVAAAPDAPVQSPRRTALRAAALLLTGGLLGGALAVTVATSSHPHTPATPPAALAVPPAPPATRKSQPAVQDPADPDPVPDRPQSVEIPKIGARSALVDLHLDLDGTLQVPQDYSAAGWYSDGPLPGDPSAPAVVVGHVDSKTGPGIFYKLSSLAVGDPVLLTLADGRRLSFTVYAAADYPKNAFPTDQVYAATTRPELRLITCTGTYDRADGHYLSNRVVYAAEATPTTKTS